MNFLILFYYKFNIKQRKYRFSIYFKQKSTTKYEQELLKYLGDNNYNVTYTAYDNEGNVLNNNVIQKQVSINSNYDLWKLFKR